MAITPADIQAQTFSEAKRGYDPAEVDVFLEKISSEVDAMLNKIVDLKNRLTASEQQLARRPRRSSPRPRLPPRRLPHPLPRRITPFPSAQISAALIAAQQTSDAIVAEAQENAERIRNEAERQGPRGHPPGSGREAERDRGDRPVSRLPARTSRTSTSSSSSTLWTRLRIPSRPTCS